MTQGLIDAAARGMGDLRRMMVDSQIRTFDVTDQRLLEVFYRTPREASLPASLVPLAYSDAPLTLPCAKPAESGRVLLQPMVLAKLLQGATLELTDRVLVVAGASGYAAALIAPLTASVVTLESDAGLSAMTTRFIDSLGLQDKVSVVTGALQQGHEAGAPYDRIVVNGGVDTGLDALFAQLAPGGCLVTIELQGTGASRRVGKAVRFDKIGSDISGRPLFDATTPVLDAFRRHETFTF